MNRENVENEQKKVGESNIEKNVENLKKQLKDYEQKIAHLNWVRHSYI